MFKYCVCTVTVLYLFALWAPTPVRADGEGATGATLQSKAETVRDSILKNDTQALYDSLAPWIQGRLKLDCAAVRKEARYIRDNAREGDIKHVNARLMIFHGVTESDDLLNELCDVSPTLYLKLALYLNHDLDLPAHPTEWLTTERVIATEDVSERHRMLGENARRRVGIVEFSHPDSWRDIGVRCVDESDSWQVVDLSLGFGASLSDVLDEDGVTNVRLDFAAPEWRKLEIRRAEGEQMLGSMKGQARVAYAIAGAPPKTLTGSIDEGGGGVGAGELEGYYFRLRDEVRSTETQGAIVVEPKDEKDLGYCLHVFTWAGGGGKFEWFTSEEDLEEALKNFQTAK